jgi:hypothetical protein
MLSGLDAAATWSKLLGKEITYAGHKDFDGFEAQLGKHSLFKQSLNRCGWERRYCLGARTWPPSSAAACHGQCGSYRIARAQGDQVRIASRHNRPADC